jgi:hypothetical protein
MYLHQPSMCHGFHPGCFYCNHYCYRNGVVIFILNTTTTTTTTTTTIINIIKA